MEFGPHAFPDSHEIQYTGMDALTATLITAAKRCAIESSPERREGRGITSESRDCDMVVQPSSGAISSQGAVPVGRQYSQGQKLPTEYTKVAQWFRLLTEQGNVKTQFALGVANSNGREVPQIKLTLSAGAGSLKSKTRSTHNLMPTTVTAGRQTTRGPCTGISKDGIAWCSVQAPSNSGNRCRREHGVARDYHEAFPVVSQGRRAESQRCHNMSNMGAAYKYGGGIDRNLTEAARWFKEAMGVGHI